MVISDCAGPRHARVARRCVRRDPRPQPAAPGRAALRARRRPRAVRDRHDRGRVGCRGACSLGDSAGVVGLVAPFVVAACGPRAGGPLRPRDGGHRRCPRRDRGGVGGRGGPRRTPAPSTWSGPCGSSRRALRVGAAQGAASPLARPIAPGSRAPGASRCWPASPGGRTTPDGRGSARPGGRRRARGPRATRGCASARPIRPGWTTVLPLRGTAHRARRRGVRVPCRWSSPSAPPRCSFARAPPRSGPPAPRARGARPGRRGRAGGRQATGAGRPGLSTGGAPGVGRGRQSRDRARGVRKVYGRKRRGRPHRSRPWAPASWSASSATTAPGRPRVLQDARGPAAPRPRAPCASAGWTCATDPAGARKKLGYVPEEPALYDYPHRAGVPGVRRRGARRGRHRGRARGDRPRRRRGPPHPRVLPGDAPEDRARRGAWSPVPRARPGRGPQRPQSAQRRAGEGRRSARCATAGTTVLLSTHILETVERVAARVVMLAHGRVVADEQVAALGAEGLERMFLQRIAESVEPDDVRRPRPAAE